MAQKLRMGYVGCGFMAQKVHMPNILALEECELLAIAEVRPKLAREVAWSLGVPRVYRDHRELALDNDIEAVAVSLHGAVQGDVAADLLLAGKHVFLEKPMAISIEQGERILNAERDSGCRLMIGYMKRYDAGNVLFKEMLDGLRKSGELGAIRFARNHGFCGDWSAGLDTPFIATDEPYPAPPPSGPAWMPEHFWNAYYGYLQQYTHNVNLLRWFLGPDQPVKVKSVDLDSDGITGIVVLEVGGVRAVIESGWVAYHGWEEHTQIYFAKGWMKTCAPPLLLRNVPASLEIYRGETEQKTLSDVFPPGGRTWSYKEEMRQFALCVKNGQPFRSPASDAIEDVRALEEIYRKHVGCLK